MATQVTLGSGVIDSASGLKLRTNGTTEAVDISTAQVATLAKDAVVNGLTVGRGAGAVSTNTAVGASALAANTSGANNTTVGQEAGLAITSGQANVAVGQQSLRANQTGNDNTALGRRSLYFATGSNNTAVGSEAAISTTTGAANTSVGAFALQSNTTASNNTAVGYQAAYNNTTGALTAIGYQAGYSNTTAQGLVWVGYQAGYVSTGNDNTGVGVQALTANTSGQYNTAIGRSALQSNTTASNNTAVGYEAGYSQQTARWNTFIGSQAGYSVTTGEGNTFVGNGYSPAGYSMTTGSKNTIIGGFGGNQGGLDIRTASNYIVLSDGDGNPRMWIAGTSGYFVPNIRSSATANNDLRFNTGNGEMYYQTSSQRYKTNIVDLEFDTSNLYNLRPVSYDDKATGERCFGLIAEETFAQIPDVVVQRDIEGEILPDSIPYSMLSVVIINEMKKLKAIVDAQAVEIAALKGTA